MCRSPTPMTSRWRAVSRFTSVESFYDFAKIVKRVAENADVDFSTKGFKGLLPQIREVLFVDTEDYKLYNNAFILRRRIPYEHGFLASDPEIVFKFRHPDMQKTADLDVRPKLISDYRLKFKAEMLPLKDEIGGLRMLYSHNVQFPLSQVHEADRASMATLLRVFPPLQVLQTSRAKRSTLFTTRLSRKCSSTLACWTLARESQPRPMWQCGERAVTEAARGRICLPVQVQASGRTPSRGDETLRAILLLAAASRAGLGLAQHGPRPERSIVSKAILRRPTNSPSTRSTSPLLTRLRRVGGG